MYLAKHRISEALLLCAYILLVHVTSALHDLVIFPYVTQRLHEPVAAVVEPVWKIIFWLAPTFLYIAYVQRGDPLTYLKLNKNVGRGIVWGVGLSLIFIPGIYLKHFVRGMPFHADFGLNAWLSAVILVGLVEEIPYRGLVFQKLQEFMGFWWASIISSLLFVALHIPYWLGLGKPLFPYITYTATYVFVFAVILCAILKRSDSLWACILIHTVNDLVSML